MRRGDLIRAFGNNAAILHDNGTERSAPIRMDVLDGELNGTRHERLIHVVALAKWGGAVWAPENCELRASVDIGSYAAASLKASINPGIKVGKTFSGIGRRGNSAESIWLQPSSGGNCEMLKRHNQRDTPCLLIQAKEEVGSFFSPNGR